MYEQTHMRKDRQTIQNTMLQIDLFYKPVYWAFRRRSIKDNMIADAGESAKNQFNFAKFPERDHLVVDE